MERRQDWRETFRAFGEALIEVLRAELAVITETWKRTGRELAFALALLVAAGYVALICLPTLLILALVAGLVALGMPIWGAALAVAGLVALLIGLIAWLAVHRLQKHAENPVATVKDRFADHTAWWNDRVLKGAEDEETAGGPDGAEQHRTGVAETGRPADRGDRSAGETPSGP